MARNELWLQLIWAAACAAIIITNELVQDGQVEWLSMLKDNNA